MVIQSGHLVRLAKATERLVRAEKAAQKARWAFEVARMVAKALARSNKA